MKDLKAQQQENHYEMRNTWSRGTNLQGEVLKTLDTLTATTWKAAQEEMLERATELLNEEIRKWHAREGTDGHFLEGLTYAHATLEELSERKVC